MDHERVKRLLPDLAAGEVAPWIGGRLRRHLARCADCSAEWQSVHTLWSALRAETQASPPVMPHWQRSDDIPAAVPTGEDREEVPMRRRFLLPTLAAGALLLTAALPLSGWLVRQQLKVAFGAGISFLGEKTASGVGTPEASYRAAANERPNDFALQLGYALRQEGSGRVAALRALVPRFGERPALRAALLQCDYSKSLGVPGTPADQGEPWTPPKNGPWEPKYRSDARTLSAFLADAEAGERLAPENAFFPMMRAYGLLAGQRADEALEAVREAGAKPRWEEYAREQIEALWALNQAANGETGALGRMVQIDVFFPRHRVELRQVARSGIGRALALEAEGKTQEGWAIREALLKVGVRMQNDSSAYISSLVGAAIAQLAQSRPGDSPKLTKEQFRRPGESDRSTQTRMVEARLAAFSEYARRIGHPEAAKRARAQADASRKIKAAWDRVFATTPLLIPGIEYTALWLGGSLFVLLSALWTIFFGGLAFLLGRTHRIQRGERLVPAVRWGIAVGLAPILLGAAWAPITLRAAWATVDFYGVVVAVTACVFTLTTLLCLRHGAKKDGQGNSLLVVGATALATLALVALAGVLVLGPTAFTGEAFRALSPREEIGESPAVPVLAGLLLGLLCMTMPVLAIISLAVWSRVRRVPASVGIVRGFRVIAVPMASLLLLGYAVLAVLAARDDARLQREMAEMIRHEGRHYMRLAGQPWPHVPE